ncbi:MAG: accessory factor UbiK family protein [Thiomicrorhabdus sp.]|nr:accessory factor UbiK family protein [Thiomicrorhabdus sp.]
MLNPTQLESMAKKMAEILPEGFGEMPEAVQSQVKSVLISAFDKMDLVTREEFDIQAAVLSKTRAKLERLEKLVSELEQQRNVE